MDLVSTPAGSVALPAHVVAKLERIESLDPGMVPGGGESPSRQIQEALSRSRPAGFRFADGEFRDLLDWYMCSDPWPLDPDCNGRMAVMLDNEALARGYPDWTTAYHRHGKKAERPRSNADLAWALAEEERSLARKRRAKP